jgi:two-component system response regulator AtoC
VRGASELGASLARALIVEDDLDHREALQKLTEGEGFTVTCAASLAEARAALASGGFDLAMLDLTLPDGSALELMPHLEELPNIDVVLVTGKGSVDSAVEAFRGGALDYLTKPIDTARLRKILGQARRAAQLRGQVSGLRNQLRELGRVGAMIGSSPAMQSIYDQIAKVALTDATVLITGETGTGKEVVAATVHELSGRAAKPFCALNCGAIAANLIESELFGHERGSFTGALRRHEGVFERASGGTLFLDEITEMPIDAQVKLLRALESREVQRIGGEKPLRVDARVIAATNRDPHAAVAAGKLRQDLLYRLLVFPIALPPLRERGDDILALANHFLAKRNRESGTRKRLTRAAAERLSLHTWPGNVRELEHAIERAFIVADEEIGPESFPFAAGAFASADAKGDALPIRVGMTMAEAERVLTLATLDRCGAKKETAERLGISLKTLYNRLREYGKS